MATPATTTSPLQATDRDFLRQFVHREAGIVLDAEKGYLLEARLTPVLARNNLQSFNALCRALQGLAGPLKQEVVEALTTHETFFFRDNHQFVALESTLLPEIIQRRAATRSISIWSAAASSGQEIYSLAMMLSEKGLAGWKIRLVATDISEQILTKAREGKYRQMEVNRGLPAKYLVKYFKQFGTEWQVKPEVRAMVEFRRFDLRQQARTLGQFDMVLCRNVLIYFDQATRDQVLKEIHSVLVPEGNLLLGTAETPGTLTNLYAWTEVGRAVVYRRK